MRKILLTCGLILGSTFTFVNFAKAEYMIDAATSSNGITYQVDLDDRSEYYSAGGWRHVIFWVSTKGNPGKYPAIASCSPYQLQSDAYNWKWLRNSWDGYSAGSVGGNIARVACNY